MQIVRDDEFDVVKAVAIWLVVLGHLYDNVCGSTVSFIQFSHMPIFFFVSGYFLWGSIQKYSMQKVLFKKTKSLLVPYLIWSMISFVANAAVIFLKDSGGGYANELIGIFFYSRSVWFLIELYFSTVLLVLLHYFAIKVRMNHYIIWMLAWIALSFLMPGELFAFYKFKWLFPFMMTGIFCAENVTLFPKKVWGERVALLLFMLLSYVFYDDKFFCSYSTFSYQTWKEVITGILYYGISLLGIIGIFALTHWKKPAVLKRLVCTIGKNSMDIYVIHMFLIKFIYWKPAINNIWLINIYIWLYSVGIVLLITFMRNKVLKGRLYGVMIGRF